MSEIAIQARGLGKRYRIGERPEKYRTLRDAVTEFLSSPLRRVSSAFRRRPDDERNSFWALNDLSFDIAMGDVVGIIGRNGAGKSTLLKILSRITEPTTGSVEILGRVRSLLEVGTGFHQELSGRENILLNGAILGMRRAEIERKFDEIVSFAEVEKFIDTPVKRYSSGMYLRLAFAVAAHLESEILLVDEVLAVGDAAFQRKCLGKMGEVADQGRTVLFVSHNMSAVKELCRKGILLDAGRIVYDGDSSGCIAEYLRRLEAAPIRLDAGSKELVLGNLQIHGETGAAGSGVHSGQPFRVTLPIAGKEVSNPMMFFLIEDFTGNLIVHSRVNSREIGVDRLDGICRLELEVPALWLAPGMYTAYFKFLIPTATSSSGRYTSEKAMLEVHNAPGSELGHHGKAILAPEISWNVAQ
ncbi:MAG: polysaccharide ABC transporter ATP-binding protein [Blastocatellia bacterium]|nr:polysaccharide ABC transporter ATP-binding protein [Blastocatellia bacterium]